MSILSLYLGVFALFALFLIIVFLFIKVLKFLWAVIRQKNV